MVSRRLNSFVNNVSSAANKFANNNPLMVVPRISNAFLAKNNGLYDYADALGNLRGGSLKQFGKTAAESTRRLGMNAVTGGLGGRLLVEGSAGTVNRAAKRARRVRRMGGGLKKQVFGATRGLGDGLRKNRGKLIDGATMTSTGVPLAFATKTISDPLNNVVKKKWGHTKLGAALTKQRKIPTKKILRRLSGGLFTEQPVFLGDIAEFANNV